MRRLRSFFSLAAFVLGLGAVTATSEVLPPAAQLTSEPSTISVTLDEAQPEVRFRIDVSSTESEGVLGLTATIDIPRDGDGSNDGVPVVDTGLVVVGAPLQDPVPDDGAEAGVLEGTFSVTRAVDASGALVLAARLRPTATSARVSFALKATQDLPSETVPDGAKLTIEIGPDVDGVDGSDDSGAP